MSAGADAREEWKAFVRDEMARELDEIVVAEKLKPAETQEFMRRAFVEGYVSEDGTAITRILKPRSRFGRGGGYSGSKIRALDALKTYFEKYREVAPPIGGSVSYAFVSLP